MRPPATGILDPPLASTACCSIKCSILLLYFSIYDSKWVREHVVKLLEEEEQYTCCLEHRDFVPTESRQKNLTTAFSFSRRIIAVVTK